MTDQVANEIIPSGYNKVNFFIIVKGGASKFIEFVEKVFGGNENKPARIPDRDGSLIHAEIQLGDSMILVADSKDDWPFTPAFPQVYVKDAQAVLDNAKQAGAEVITIVTNFYNGIKIARFKDPWGNPYIYATNSASSYSVMSAGPDGNLANDADNIVSGR